MQKLQLNRELTVYNDILGGSERLLRTPIPLSYTRNSSRFLTLCLLFFPLATVAKLGLAVVPVTAFVSFLFLGVPPPQAASHSCPRWNAAVLDRPGPVVSDGHWLAFGCCPSGPCMLRVDRTCAMQASTKWAMRSKSRSASCPWR